MREGNNGFKSNFVESFLNGRMMRSRETRINLHSFSRDGFLILRKSPRARVCRHEVDRFMIL